eukprot:symbB.v1.2.038165.t3/scaffold5820.1/size23329/2
MAEKDVAIYGLVSEPQAKADLAKSEWNISYDVIGSQDVSLVKYLEDEKIINLVISEHKDKETYPNGMVQPGLLFIRRSDRAVLFNWAVRPDSSFSEFASYRPTPADVWAAVSAKLTAPVSELPVSPDKMGIDGIGKMFYRNFCSCGPVHRREVLRQWGKDGFKELENLKRKFILPFACENPMGISIWQPNLLPVPSEFEVDVSQPLCITFEQIQEEATDYAENAFPLELLSTRRDPLFFDGIRQSLQSSEVSRLIGLAAHLVYWNALGHFHPPQHRLPSSTRHSLVLTMQEVWSKINDAPSIRKADGPARGFYIPVFLVFIKWGIEQVFRLQYPKLLDDKGNNEGEFALGHFVSDFFYRPQNSRHPSPARVTHQRDHHGALRSRLRSRQFWHIGHVIGGNQTLA